MFNYLFFNLAVNKRGSASFSRVTFSLATLSPNGNDETETGREGMEQHIF
jgi:hypothetical protein